MPRPALALSTLVLLLAGAGAAAAQDQPTFGVTLGYPGSIGLTWQPSSRVAIRPTVTFARGGIESISGNDSESSALSASLSGLLYLNVTGPLRVYVSPRYVYTRGTTRASTTIQTPSIGPSGVIFATSTVLSEARRREHGGAGLVGAEYRLGERFAIFGEAGVQYARFRSRTSNSLTPVASTPSGLWSVGTVGGVGVTIYF